MKIPDKHLLYTPVPPPGQEACPILKKWEETEKKTLEQERETLNEGSSNNRAWKLGAIVGLVSSVALSLFGYLCYLDSFGFASIAAQSLLINLSVGIAIGVGIGVITFVVLKCLNSQNEQADSIDQKRKKRLEGKIIMIKYNISEANSGRLLMPAFQVIQQKAALDYFEKNLKKYNDSVEKPPCIPFALIEKLFT